MKHIVFLSLILTSCIVKNVDIGANERGVVGHELLKNGSHYIRSDKKVTIYPIDENTYSDNLTFLTKDNLDHITNFKTKFYISEGDVLNVHSRCTDQYQMVCVSPETRASIRRVLLTISSDSLIMLSKDTLQAIIFNDLESTLKKIGFSLTYFSLDKIQYPGELETVISLNLENEYRTIKTSNEWTEKRKAIDALLKTDSKEIMVILMRMYNEDNDKQTKDYIISHIKSTYP